MTASLRGGAIGGQVILTVSIPAADAANLSGRAGHVYAGWHVSPAQRGAGRTASRAGWHRRPEVNCWGNHAACWDHSQALCHSSPLPALTPWSAGQGGGGGGDYYMYAVEE
jgi:hypothetical protein